jgi:DNA-binding NtrC family response regulator/pSer/pThr/pTyr-binding forkhead associated (FHA) protein
MSSVQYEEELTGEGVSRAEPSAFQLVVFLESGVVLRTLAGKQNVTIGRSRDADVMVPHASVSRQHAVLDVRAMTFTDLASRNGSTVHGERVPAHKPVTIGAGDAIVVGDITMILQIEGTTAVPALTATMIQDLPLELRLVEEVARSARHGEPFVHARIHVAPTHADSAREILIDALRTSDVLAEDGPGRFQLLLPAIDHERGRSVLQRLVGMLGGHGISARSGIAAYPVDGITAAQLSARAREMVTSSRRDMSAMDNVRRLVSSVAPGDLTVLVVGETGVGKELFAEMVHRVSPRAKNPFLRVNCAAIAEPLLESELFGHMRGAFTGADSARVGLIETAAGGTLFLDEIGEMGLRLQATLLRVLEERVVRRIGESEGRPVDVRIVCATNRSLLEEVEAGRFRRDLYYRISGVTLKVPPLRDRVDEIEGIARAFAALATARTRRAVPLFTDEAIQAIRGCAWPGNVRELRNSIERAVLLAGEGPIRPTELGLITPIPHEPSNGAVTEPALSRPSRSSLTMKALSTEVADLERRRIVEALEEYGGNQTRAARALGISRTTLIARLDAYGLRRPRKS